MDKIRFIWISCSIIPLVWGCIVEEESTKTWQIPSVESFVEFFHHFSFFFKLLWQSFCFITNLCFPHERREMQFFTWPQVQNQCLLNIGIWPAVILFPFFRTRCSFPLAHSSTCATEGYIILMIYAPWISVKKIRIRRPDKLQFICAFAYSQKASVSVIISVLPLRLPVHPYASAGIPLGGFSRYMMLETAIKTGR